MGVLGRFGSSLTAWWCTHEVTVAVAGLARSGKTAFITSVVANLQAAGSNSGAARWLNGLRGVDTRRLCSAGQPPNYRPTHCNRVFPFTDALSALAGDKPR